MNNFRKFDNRSEMSEIKFYSIATNPHFQEL
jgi:hypothetical protein